MEYRPNEDNSMVLCSISTVAANKSGYGVSFFIYDHNTKTIVLEENIDKGTVGWYSNTELSMFYTPGIMQVDQTRDDYTFIYNLNTREKVRKNTLKY